MKSMNVSDCCTKLKHLKLQENPSQKTGAETFLHLSCHTKSFCRSVLGGKNGSADTACSPTVDLLTTELVSTAEFVLTGLSNISCQHTQTWMDRYHFKIVWLSSHFNNILMKKKSWKDIWNYIAYCYQFTSPFYKQCNSFAIWRNWLVSNKYNKWI